MNKINSFIIFWNQLCAAQNVKKHYNNFLLLWFFMSLLLFLLSESVFWCFSRHSWWGQSRSEVERATKLLMHSDWNQGPRNYTFSVSNNKATRTSLCLFDLVTPVTPVGSCISSSCTGFYTKGTFCSFLLAGEPKQQAESYWKLQNEKPLLSNILLNKT